MSANPFEDIDSILFNMKKGERVTIPVREIPKTWKIASGVKRIGPFVFSIVVSDTAIIVERRS